MTTREQALCILAKLKANNPVEVLKKFNDINSGMKFILIHLDEAKSEVFASELSELMCISRARVSFMLKKMEQKGLISRKTSVNDSRKEVLSLTTLGKSQLEYEQQKVIDNLTQVIDHIGIDKINQFIEIGDQIKRFLDS